MQKLGLFGGGFDPIHEGHLHIAELAQKELNLDKVIFIPLGQAVHKDQPLHSPEERIALIHRAIQNKPGFEVDEREIIHAKPSYTIETVREYVRNFTGVDLYYIIGSDAFEKFFTWKEPGKLLDLVKFIVVSRPGYDFSKIEAMFSSAERGKYLDRIFLVADEGIDISSTKLRDQIRERKNASKS